MCREGEFLLCTRVNPHQTTIFGEYFWRPRFPDTSRKSIRILYQADGNSPEKIGSTETPVAATMDAGSVLIFDDRILHRGGHNRAFCDRDVAFFSYRNLELLAFYRDHYITCLAGIKQCKCMVNLRDFPLIVHCLGW